MTIEIDPRFAKVYDPLFDSAWLKWSHGVGHAQALDADIDAFDVAGHADPLRGVRAEYHPKRHGFAVVATDVAVVPAQWGLVLGDVAHNYRSALDHLAWAIVRRGRTPPNVLSESQQTAVQFPIAEGRRQFNDSLERRLPGARPRDVAKVRRRQPYQYRSQWRRRRHFLTVLAALNNSDKHRTLQPIWTQPTRIDIEIRRMQDCSVPRIGWTRRATPLEVGSEIAFIRARKLGSRPGLDLRVRTTGEPSIGNRIPVKTWIAQCAAFTVLTLREFSEPPQGVIDQAERWAWFAEHAQRIG
jgi:hypothetical protein